MHGGPCGFGEEFLVSAYRRVGFAKNLDPNYFATRSPTAGSGGHHVAAQRAVAPQPPLN